MINKENIVILNEEQLKRYQQELLKIVGDLVRVCDKEGLNYSLSGGSVIGAVRHKGIIPWDDDIDINMPRKSYERLLKIFDKELGDNYYIQTPQTYPNLGIMVTQVREKGTIARRKYDWNTNPCGISIDIYIVENVFENRLKRMVQKNLSMILAFIISSIRMLNNKEIPKEISEIEAKPVKYSRLKIIVGKILKKISLANWIKWLDKINGLCKNEKSTYVTIPTGRKHFNGEMQERSNLLQYKKVPFENMELNIPKNYDSYLNNLYGDNYMEIPSKDKRESHVFLELRYK